MAKVTSKDRTFFVHTNVSAWIPARQSHRLQNPAQIYIAMFTRTNRGNGVNQRKTVNPTSGERLRL
jgi:mannose-6-phosphate isomerase-like protein (cupin superfamily)